jgi:hypothetical protein
VDKLRGALALARRDEGVLVVIFFFKTDAAALAGLKGEGVTVHGSGEASSND